jgi:hypothetical protein
LGKEIGETVVLKPVYAADATGSIAIEISQEELRAVLGEIESELYHSEVYRRVVAGLQTIMGEAAGGAQTLVKAVGREAIRLAFRQFFKQYRAMSSAPQSNPSAPEATSQITVSPTAAVATPVSEPVDESIPSTDEAPPAATFTVTEEPATSSPEEPPLVLGLLPKPGKKLSKAELAAQKFTEEREESLRQVGEEIRQARQARSLSLHQLHSLTLVPLYQLTALESGRLERLPEDVYVRGFVRRIGDALGIGGDRLAASIPAPDPVKAVLPTWYHPEPESGLYLRPMHLYVGYAALMAGAVGGLTWISQQNAQQAATNNTQVFPSQAAVTPTTREAIPTSKPGVKKTKIGVVAGPDIAPPEAFSN